MELDVIIVLTPESELWDWQAADPLVAALIEQGGVVIAVDYGDAAAPPEASEVAT